MYICIHNRLLDLSYPRVMAIVNVSPDSFYISCDSTDEQTLLSRVEQMIKAGADILDIGACSTRPGAQPVDADTEWKLLSQGLNRIRHHWPDVPISVDTFRANIAELAMQNGADMINDVAGAKADPRMWEIAAKNHIPYVLTHAQPVTAPTTGEYDHTMTQVLHFLQQQLDILHRLGLADAIIDPGFGFEKTLKQNYALLNRLDIFQVLHVPILVGISRKSMLYKPLESTPHDVLPATIAAHTIALERGANILRVHDVEAATQAIKIHQLTHNSNI